ncbi:hypothetical protein HCC61_16500 [Streptomyces sp. HNM0575]|uniref:hypothetical protein n=1 Tax=Streptomyces sp. HNM0575 TaxID=2716338 RepID=UPI00145CE446|nr:hypothetical protein [Streptomyces sp. HNM0575]NLU74262.1 hypothetical protein [Streptomyces sp. HNM0575]
MTAAASPSPSASAAATDAAGPFRGDGRHRVAVLVRPGVMPLEPGLVHQMFGAARRPGGWTVRWRCGSWRSGSR